MRISDWSSDVCSSDLFRPPPDPHSLDLLRPAGADAELSWAGGVADRRPGGHPEPLLQARARLVPPAAGDRRPAGRHHRQPGGDIGCLIGDAAGDPAWSHPTAPPIGGASWRERGGPYIAVSGGAG